SVEPDVAGVRGLREQLRLRFQHECADHCDCRHSGVGRSGADARWQLTLQWRWSGAVFLAVTDSRTASFSRRGRNEQSRSEEHTSELQSRENLVCRLLLEKKKPCV